MEDINAESAPELLNILRSIDISAPPITEGRTKEQREKYGVAYHP